MENATREKLEVVRNNFTALRRAKGWTLKELSEISGISVKALTDAEEGGEFDVLYFLKLCLIYCSEPYEIFSESGSHEFSVLK